MRAVERLDSDECVRRSRLGAALEDLVETGECRALLVVVPVDDVGDQLDDVVDGGTVGLQALLEVPAVESNGTFASTDLARDFI